MRLPVRYVTALGVCLMLAACSSSATSGSAPVSSSAVVPSGSSASSAPTTPDETLPARWWVWAASSAQAVNPIADATGAACATNQPEDVWFLAGTFGDGPVSRRCTVPANRPIYIPVLNNVCSVRSGESADAAAKACEGRVDRAEATIDGKPVEFPVATSEGVFTLTTVAGNPVMDLASTPAVAWGLWVGPTTLAPGPHVLHVVGVSAAFTVDVTYDLTVASP